MSSSIRTLEGTFTKTTYAARRDLLHGNRISQSGMERKYLVVFPDSVTEK